MRTATAAVPETTFPSHRMLALRGVLMLVFGLAEGALLLFAFHIPHITASLLVLVLAGFVLADGLATLFESVAALNRRGRWIWPAANALAGIAAAVIILFATRRPLTVFAWWAIVTGVLEMWAALSTSDATRSRIAVAALSMALGLFMLAGPFQDGARLLLATAVYGVIAGGLRVRAARRGIRMDRNVLTWVFVLVLLGVAAGCQRAPSAKAAPASPDVVVAEVEQRTVPIIRDFTARTEAVPTVEIRARVAGVLEQVLFKEGTEAKQGQLLFIIQKGEYNAALESARAQLAKAHADLTRARDTSVVDRARAVVDQRQADLGKATQDVARYRPLAEAKAIPQQDLDTSVAQEKVAAAGVEAAQAGLRDAQLAQRTQVQLGEAAVESAKASIVQADLNLSYTTIHAPITGIIGKLAVDVGNLVGKADPTLLTTISAVDPIYVDFNVAEVDYLRLASRVRLDPQGRTETAPATLELFLADDTVFGHKGRMVFVDRAVDAKTGTIGVRAGFPNPQRVLRPGQFGRVRGVVEERRDAILVPQLAVQEQQGVRTVLVVEEGDTVALRSVTLGERVGDFYIATAGVKPGERVIIEGMQRVRPGIQVKPMPKVAAKAGP